MGGGYSGRQPVVFVRKNGGRFKTFGFLWCHQGVGDDDDDVAGLALSGSGAIEADDTGIAFAPDGISLQPLAVVVVDDLHSYS